MRRSNRFIQEINDLLEGNDSNIELGNKEYLIGERTSSNMFQDVVEDIAKDEVHRHILGDIDLLVEMGYNRATVNKIYVLLEPPNIERAVDYLTEIDGVYQHNFYEHRKGQHKDLCFICRKERKYHFDYKDNNDNKIEESSEDYDDYSTPLDVKKTSDEMKYCYICDEDFPKEDEVITPCGHNDYCRNCWYKYLETNINEAKVTDIKCMEFKCKELLTDKFINDFIGNDKKLLDKYERFKKRAEILKDPNKRQCPEPDCESFLLKDPKTTFVQCQNGHKYCFNCMKPWHEKKKCAEIIDESFQNWAKTKVVKRCPRCQMFTEKNEGCNHMTCIKCHYQWCWLCLGKYDYGHYDRGICKGLWFTKAKDLEDAYRVQFGGDYKHKLEVNKNILEQENIRKANLKNNTCYFYKYFPIPIFDFRNEENEVEGCGAFGTNLFLLFFGLGATFYFHIFLYFNDKLTVSEVVVGFNAFFLIFMSLIFNFIYIFLWLLFYIPFFFITLFYPKFARKIITFLQICADSVD